MTTTHKNSAVSININDCLELARPAEGLSLKPQQVRNAQSGQYLSSLRGRGMEFDELRLYQPGDDIRAIDWNVTARSGKTHTKLYREERDRPVIFWIDLRPNMLFATRVAYKAVIAAKVSALLSWAAYRNNDKIGGLLFSAHQHIEVRPNSGRKGLSHWFQQLSDHPAFDLQQTNTIQQNTPQEKWQNALKRLNRVTHPGSLVFMISDFIDFSDQDTPYFTKLAKHNDVSLIQINDIFEQTLPVSGNLRINQNKNWLTLNTQSKKIREQYTHRYTKQQTIIKQLCLKERMQYINLLTQDDYIAKLRTIYRNKP